MNNEKSEFEQERDLLFANRYQYENYRCQVYTLLTNALTEENDGRSRLITDGREIFKLYCQAFQHAEVCGSDFAQVLTLDPDFPLEVYYEECASCGSRLLSLTYKWGFVPRSRLE